MWQGRGAPILLGIDEATRALLCLRLTNVLGGIVPAQLVIDGSVYNASDASALHRVYMAIRAIIDRKDTNQVVFNGSSGDREVVTSVMVTEHTSVQFVVFSGDGDDTARQILDIAKPNAEDLLALYGTGRDPLPSAEDDGDWKVDRI